MGARGAASVMGSDFCHPMLVEAQRKIGKTELRAPLFEADALALPLAHESLDLITIAFGFRNLANYERGIYELERVLKPGGTLAVLEFSQPTNKVFGALYGFFSKYVLPLVSIVWGNLAAMRQASFRRMIAYSSIAHAGYALLGVIAATPEGVSRATTRTVVVASLAVLGLDFVLTALMFSI